MDQQRISELESSYRSDNTKRKEIVNICDLKEEQWFWARFFTEVDKRSIFLAATFVKKNFGLRINYNELLKKDVQSYSLMTYKDGTLYMNKMTKNGKTYNTWVDRFADHCVDETIAHEFSKNLRANNLLRAGAIDPYYLVENKDEEFVEGIISKLFNCLDRIREQSDNLPPNILL